MKAQPIPKGSCAACYLATMDSASSRQLSALYNTRPARHTGRDAWGAGGKISPDPHLISCNSLNFVHSLNSES
jgi:hypothetical protein